MRFKAEIDVMPLDALLDPQGKAVTSSMKNIGLDAVADVRIGRHVRLFLEAESQEEASKHQSQGHAPTHQRRAPRPDTNLSLLL